MRAELPLCYHKEDGLSIYVVLHFCWCLFQVRFLFELSKMRRVQIRTGLRWRVRSSSKIGLRSLIEISILRIFILKRKIDTGLVDRNITFSGEKTFLQSDEV